MNFGIVASEEDRIEQEKVKKFFDKLLDNSVKKVASWIVVGIFLFLLMILCMIPAQEVYYEADGSPFISGIMVIFSFWMASMRVYVYKHYTENQKVKLMTDILQYHPVCKMDIRRYKMSVLFTFMGKVTAVGLVLQIIASLIAYKTISWMNFIHIIIWVFLFPVGGEVLFDAMVDKLIKE